jgi:hypothetical protein
LIFNGGKQLYDIAPQNQRESTTLNICSSLKSPGIRAAYPSKNYGSLSETAHTRGTSNATALISRTAEQCYDMLLNIINDNHYININDSQIIALLKTILVHGCAWRETGEQIDRILRTSEHTSERSNIIKQKIKQKISRWIGYGIPNVQRVLECTKQRVTLLGFGQLQEDEANVFRLPLPQSLSGVEIKRRLTVTLAWLSPVVASTQKYRTARLWFEVNRNEVNRKNIVDQRCDVDWQMARRGTVQHEIFEGEKNVPYSENEILEIKVNCKSDAKKIVSPISYGLAVSLEVADGLDIAIYDEVRTLIDNIVPIQRINTVQ